MIDMTGFYCSMVIRFISILLFFFHSTHFSRKQKIDILFDYCSPEVFESQVYKTSVVKR